ncbi:hypothetical protein G9A89_005310 [Geosiphon pyriformis]|nr:hypothetical protein G9A89_005310 [Geosiphon pyriformis]
MAERQQIFDDSLVLDNGVKDLHIRFQHGKKYRDIANIVNCSLTTVSDTIKRFKETGAIDSRPRSERPRLFTHQKYRRLKRLVTLNGKI